MGSAIVKENRMDKLKWILKNLHFFVSLAIVLPTAIIYGSPSILQKFLDIQVNSNDLSNMLKSVMCLYFGISFVWITGILKTQYWKSATQLNVLFMFALATGRVLSMLLDGLPTVGYIFGVIAEFLIGLYAFYQLKKYKIE